MTFDFKEMEKPDIISKYRDSLMGIAILWIVILHSELNFGNGFLGYVFLFLKQTGYLGVDIFFFISGFGLMTGWYKKKNPSILFFYKRRFLRIMPIFWFFLIVNLILLALFGSVWDLNTLIINLTGFGFFFTGYHWFISAILLCYLIFPFFAKYFQQNKTKLRLLILIISSCLIFALILSVSELLFVNTFNKFLIIILRLPAFFIGSAIGYLYITNNIKYKYIFKISLNVLLTFFCYTSLALIYLFSSVESRWLYGLYWYPFVLSSFSLTFLLSYFLSYFHQIHSGYFIYYLNTIGKSSLELYFTHSLIFSNIDMIKEIFNYFGIFIDGNFSWLFAILFSVIIALVFNRIFSKIVNS